ncbi:MAG: methionyl-tRNA formyltransferase [Deltaproteobacteria bacterium]
MPPFRVVFLGTPRFAVPSLAALAERETVTLVVTNPDRPAGRGRTVVASPVKEEALRRSIPVFQPEKARSPESVERIRAEAPDLIVVVAYGQILPESILSIPRICCVNVHASLLPKYRGAAPIQWAIARGETVTGVTIMRMDAGMDTGPILLAREVPIGEEDTAGTMFERLAAVGAETLSEALHRLRAGTLPEIPQDDAQATYAPMLRKEHGAIDWGKTAREIRNLVRGMTPWPSAHAFHEGKTLKILEVSPGATGRAGGASPGEVLSVGKEGIEVACGGGSIRLVRVQPEGGKSMTAWDFAQGRRIRKGVRLSR